MYSPFLTWVVMASLPFYIAISAGMTPLFRTRLDEKFKRGAEKPGLPRRKRSRDRNAEGDGR
jgi:ABC-type bacteriocin/lantibiotic exporter with double-glycine peptidase domain